MRCLLLAAAVTAATIIPVHADDYAGGAIKSIGLLVVEISSGSAPTLVFVKVTKPGSSTQTRPAVWAAVG